MDMKKQEGKKLEGSKDHDRTDVEVGSSQMEHTWADDMWLGCQGWCEGQLPFSQLVFLNKLTQKC